MISGDDIRYNANRRPQSPARSRNHSIHVRSVRSSDHQSTGTGIQIRGLNLRFCLSTKIIDVSCGCDRGILGPSSGNVESLKSFCRRSVNH